MTHPWVTVCVFCIGSRIQPHVARELAILEQRVAFMHVFTPRLKLNFAGRLKTDAMFSTPAFSTPTFSAPQDVHRGKLEFRGYL